MSKSAGYSVSVRNLCEFAAKAGDLDLRFTPSPSAQQGREGHQLVASRRPPSYEAEVSLSGSYTAPNTRADAANDLRVSGRADGFDAESQVTFRLVAFRHVLGNQFEILIKIDDSVFLDSKLFDFFFVVFIKSNNCAFTVAIICSVFSSFCCSVS